MIVFNSIVKQNAEPTRAYHPVVKSGNSPFPIPMTINILLDKGKREKREKREKKEKNSEKKNNKITLPVRHRYVINELTPVKQSEMLHSQLTWLMPYS